MRWIAALWLSASTTWANPMILEDFTDGEAAGWSYTSDRVMGGVSNGGAAFMQEDGTTFARLAGEVSTANNGGFIQIRRQLSAPFPDASTGLTLTARGNGERYYIHLRPTTSRRPWQYYAASFESSGDWSEVTLNWSDFKPQGGLPEGVDPAQITSIGIVAYGADYSAELDVKMVEVISPSS